MSEADEAGTTKTLVEKASGFSLALAVVVFMANMIAAWWITGESTEVIARPLVADHATAVSLALDAAPQASANNHVLLNRLLNTELMLRAAQNRHTITVVALSVAFALVAIGFALFVMGAEGAFRLEGSAGTQGNLMVKATAPGLLCFVLAVVIVCFALLSKTDMELGKFTVYPDSQSSGPPTSEVTYAGDDGYTVSADQVYAPEEFMPEEPEPLPDEGDEAWDNEQETDLNESEQVE